MTLRSPCLVLVAAVLVLTACDRPKGAPPPAQVPTQAPVAVPAAPRPIRPAEPIVWDETSGRFTLDGMVLKTAQLWRFDGVTEGFSGGGVQLETVSGGGLRVTEQNPDPIVRSPQNLAIEGGRYNAVLVRLMREKASPKWDGSLFYATAAHGEANEFHTKPLRGANPVEGETTIMVYDMAHLKKGGEDWSSSIVTGLRLDLDDSAGGVFRIHQIAVVSLPPVATSLSSQ